MCIASSHTLLPIFRIGANSHLRFASSLYFACAAAISSFRKLRRSFIMLANSSALIYAGGVNYAIIG